MKKQKWVLLLAAMLTAFLLCGCSQYDDQYDDEAFLSDSANHYAAIQWWGNIQKDGSYALKVGSFSGVKTLGSFTVEEDQTLCEVQSTLTGTKGERKPNIVNSLYLQPKELEDTVKARFERYAMVQEKEVMIEEYQM